MAEIGSVQQPGDAKPPQDASTGTGAPAVEPASAAPNPSDASNGTTAPAETAPQPGPPTPGAQDAAVATAQDTIVREPPTVRLAVVGDPARPTQPADGARATSFLERAVLRRRIRFLRRRRELALHDLGGFVYETHRLGESRPELTTEKLDGVDVIDGELATLERALGLGEELIVLHEPGISSCTHCSTIHDSAARFCPSCGRPRSGSGA